MDLPAVFDLPIALFVARPYVALAPAILFGVGYVRLRGRPLARVTLAAALFWTLYAAYEGYMFFWAKTVTAPIRIDLLLLTPLLYLATAAGLFGWWWGARRGRGGQQTRVTGASP